MAADHGGGRLCDIQFPGGRKNAHGGDRHENPGTESSDIEMV